MEGGRGDMERGREEAVREGGREGGGGGGGGRFIYSPNWCKRAMEGGREGDFWSTMCSPNWSVLAYQCCSPPLQVQYWVVTEVVREVDLVKRVAIIKKFIKIAG